MSNAFKGLKIEDDDEEEVVVIPKTVAKPVTPAPAPVPAPASTSTYNKKGGDRSTTTYTPGEKKFRPRNSDDAAFDGEKKRTPRAPRGDKPAHESNKNERQSHDGRGQGNQVKRGGRGKANWGNAEDELKNPAESQLSETPEAATNGEAKPEGEVAAGAAEPVAEVAPVAAEPEGPKTLSLEEFKKQQAAASVKIASKPIRQANEGTDLSQWAGAEQIKHNDDSKTSENKIKVGTTQRSGRVQLLDVSFGAPSYESRPPRTGPRPTTAGDQPKKTGEYKGKSTGGRGGYKGTRVPNVASNVDFPSL